MSDEPCTSDGSTVPDASVDEQSGEGAGATWEDAAEGASEPQAESVAAPLPALQGPLPYALALPFTEGPYAPVKVARDVLHQFRLLGFHVVRWRSTWLVYRAGASRGRYESINEDDDRVVMVDLVRRTLEDTKYMKATANGPEERSWNPTTQSVREVASAIETICRLPAQVEPGSWLDPRIPMPSDEIIVCRNGLLHVPPGEPRTLYGHTPLYFADTSIDIDYHPDAPEPVNWLRFLGQLWPGDPQSIAALQEWFGYVLSGSTLLHKILLLIGPPRGGKGTIVRVLTLLVGGESEVPNPSLRDLRGDFGLQPLLGKRLAVITDARTGGSDTSSLVENLLRVSGGDTVDINRKNKPHLIGVKLLARFMIAANEDIQLADASGAMPNRFVPLVLTESWLGREDLTLLDKLTSEAPGILNWGLDGLDRLRVQGGFTMSQTSRTALDTLVGEAQPVKLFGEEHCIIDESGTLEVQVAALWQRAQWWAGLNGYTREIPNERVFGRMLRAAYPHIRKRRPGPRGQQVWVYSGIGLRDDEAVSTTSKIHI